MLNVKILDEELQPHNLHMTVVEASIGSQYFPMASLAWCYLIMWVGSMTLYHVRLCGPLNKVRLIAYYSHKQADTWKFGWSYKNNIREKVTFTYNLFFKANSIVNLVDCTWTLKKLHFETIYLWVHVLQFHRAKKKFFFNHKYYVLIAI